MFQLYLKREQYQKVSSKFKDHLFNRNDKISFVTDKDTKIQEKMKVFNELINDDFQGHKNPPSMINTFKCFDSHHNYTTVKECNLKQNSSEKKYLKQLMNMTDGMNECTASKKNKSLQKENIFGWTHYQREKLKKVNNQEKILQKTLEQGQNLKLSKSAHRKQRFSTEMKNKIQDKISPQKLSKQTFFSSLRNSRVKQQILIQDENKSKEKKKQKQKKYFCEMKQFRGHKKYLSQVFSINNMNGSRLRRGINQQLQKSVLNKTFCNSMSNNYLLNMLTTKLLSSKNDDEFKDDKIHASTMFQNSTLFQDYEKQSQNKVDFQNINKKNLQKMPHNLVNSISKKRGFHIRNMTTILDGSNNNSIVIIENSASIQRKKIQALMQKIKYQ